MMRSQITDERGRLTMNCPYCQALIHPDVHSCFSCGRYIPAPSQRVSSDRIHEWQSIANTPEHAAEPTQQAGDEGERWLQSVLGAYVQHKGAHLFTNKRIPEPEARRRQEIDVIVVTQQRLYVFEVKRWSGLLTKRHDQWIQVNRSNKEILQKDAIRVNRSKTDVLLRYLHAQNIVVPIPNVSHKVIFTETNLVILDDTILRDPDVIHLGRLRNSVTAQEIIDYCLEYERDDFLSYMFEADMRQLFPGIVAAIQKTGTWDRLGLYGGETKKGDIRHLRLGDDVMFREHFESGWQLDLHWTRTQDGLLRAFLDLDIGTMRFPDGRERSVGVEDHILFHVVGDANPTRIPLKNIDYILIG